MGTKPVETMVTVDRLDLALLEAGAGGAPLLLIHGFTGAKEDFRDYLEPLAILGFHAVSVDLRGHGASAKPAEPTLYSLGSMTADVVGVLDALGWPTAMVIGHSMGGMIAQRLVIDYPERVARLVLMSTCQGPVPGLTADIAALAVATVRQGGMRAYLEAMRSGFGLGVPVAKANNDPAYERYCDAKVLACAPAMFCGMVADMATTDDRMLQLARVTHDTLVVVGSRDVWMREASGQLAKLLANARYVELPDGGHSPQFEDADRWWTAVSGFLLADASRPAP